MSLSVYHNPELDEITFEHRHKAYGAYQLRKMYNERLLSAFLISIGIFCGLLLILLLMVSGIKPNNIVKKVEREISDFTEIIIPPKSLTNIHSFSNTKQKVNKTKVIENTIPIVVEKKEADEEKNTSSSNIDISTFGDEIFGDETFNLDQNTSSGASSLGTENPKKTPQYVAAEMPEFPGGIKKLMQFLSSNLKYPEHEKEKGTQGKPVVSFVINEVGEAEDIKILKSIGKAFDQEIIRVLKLMPKWKPGRNNAGQPVSVKHALPIEFKLYGQ